MRATFTTRTGSTAEGHPRRRRAVQGAERPLGREGVPEPPPRASRLRGPLAVEGGPTGADRSLVNGVMLPGEVDSPLFAIGDQPPESQMIDVLNIYDDARKGAGVGTMTSTRLVGFDMADDLVLTSDQTTFGEPVVFPGGITWGQITDVDGKFETDGGQSTIEVVNLMLGYQNNTLDIQGTLDPAPAVQSKTPSPSSPSARPRSSATTTRGTGSRGVTGSARPSPSTASRALEDRRASTVEHPCSERTNIRTSPVPTSGDQLARIIAKEPDVIVTGVTTVTPTAIIDIKIDGLTTRHRARCRLPRGSPDQRRRLGTDHVAAARDPRRRHPAPAGRRPLRTADRERTAPAYRAAVERHTHDRTSRAPMVASPSSTAVATDRSTHRRAVDGRNTLTRTDGRSWTENGFKVGDYIQVDAEPNTRKILDFVESTRVPHRPRTHRMGGLRRRIDAPPQRRDHRQPRRTDRAHVAKPYIDAATGAMEIHTDHLGSGTRNWDAAGFKVGQIVYISGMAGGFTVSGIDGTSLTLSGATLTPTISSPTGPTYSTVALRSSATT